MQPVDFQVNADTCIRCGLCVDDCVAGIIRMEDVPAIRPEDRQWCIHCGHCQAICPTASITLDGHDPQSLEPCAQPLPEDLAKAMVRGRRSVRHFAPHALERGRLEKIIELASCAPTAKNMREVAYIVFNGREQVEKLALSTAELMRKHNFLNEIAEKVFAGEDIIFRGAPCVIITHAPEKLLAPVDCATALATLELILPSFGLGSCWAGYFTHVCDRELPAEIELPAGNRVYGGLMVGRPTVSYKRVPFRSKPEIRWL